MTRMQTVLWSLGVLCGVGIMLSGLLRPVPAEAGGLHVSIGLGIPVPVGVVPAPVVVAPAPIIVQQPPVVVVPSPVIVQPAPVIAYPPPLVVGPPVVAYPPYLSPGFAQPYRGDPAGDGYRWARHWKHGHHDDE